MSKKLNNFQKKTIISELKDFDIISIVGHIESSDVIKYSFYYEYKEIVFVCELFWAYNRSSAVTPALEDFVAYLKERLSQETARIDVEIFGEKKLFGEGIDFHTDILFNFITSQLYIITNLDNTDDCISKLSNYDISTEIRNLLVEGLSIDKVYERVFADLGLERENLLNLISTYNEE